MKKLYLLIVLSMALLSMILSTKPYAFDGPSDFYYGIILGTTIGLEFSLIILYKIIRQAPTK